jgi:glutaredoxin 3
MTKITVYHKDYCPYCKAAKQLLTSQGFEYSEVEVTNNPVEFASMVERSGRRTVPQIFIGDIHIGGFDDLQSRFADSKFPFNQISAA